MNVIRRNKQNIQLVLKSLIANKNRNFFTCLGIIIGIAAFLCMSSLYNVTSLMDRADWERYGYKNFVFELYDLTLRPGGWSQKDIDFLESLDGVLCSDPYVNCHEPVTVRANGKHFDTVSLMGRSGEYYQYLYDAKIRSGRAISVEDNEKAKRVCILDEVIAEELFGGIDCIGQMIRLGTVTYEVIGVDSHDYTTMDRDYYIADKMVEGYIAIPINTLVKEKGLTVSNITIFMSDNDPYAVRDSHEKAVAYLEENLHLNADEGFGDYYYGDDYFAGEEEQAKRNLRKKIVSLICLLVGGVGVMNMMLVSVAERTREIGLRKALGATAERIQFQFLMESVILSTIGGILGAIVGLIFTFLVDIYASYSLSQLMQKQVVVTYVDWGGLLFGFTASVFVGILFGYLPARKASKMNPIDALKM